MDALPHEPAYLLLQAVLKGFEGVQAAMQDGLEMCSVPGTFISFSTAFADELLCSMKGSASCAASVAKSIELCDADIRKDMYSGVIATGGLSILHAIICKQLPGKPATKHSMLPAYCF